MQKVLTAAQMREVDRLTTERYGIPSIILMENAAHAVARVITEKLGCSVKGKSILILCGKGNNGGDGAALARILWMQGASIHIFLFGKVEDTKGDARINFEIARQHESIGVAFPGSKLGLKCFYFREIDDSTEFWELTKNLREDVCVDALFGTGLTRRAEGIYESVIRTLNHGIPRGRESFIVSIDVPSGIDADSQFFFDSTLPTGTTVESDRTTAAMPDVTVTFTAPKVANVLPPALHASKEVNIADIGSPEELVEEQPSTLFLAESEDARYWLSNTQLLADSYKNKRGHALVIAGSEDYSGAAVLAGNAAMRSGVGLVTAACPVNAKAEIASRLLPDVILKTFESFEANELTNDVDAVAVGCGLDANDPAIEKLVRAVIENRKVPVIVDAGALWFFNSPKSFPIDQDRPPLIFTPHEGEFLRLLGTDDKNVIKDRVDAVREFATKHNVILVLKGERVLIGAPDGRVVVNPTGNAGLGKAGNGDTLTGILAGFVAQATKMNIDIFETVVAAVYVAGMAGDVAEKKYGKRVMTASDVRECLADVFATFEEK